MKAGLLKNHSIIELEVGLMLESEKYAYLSEIEAGFVQQIIARVYIICWWK